MDTALIFHGVSIHAPVMGANIALNDLAITANVSIHAPVMGAKPPRIILANQNRFQSTHP